MKPSIQKLQKIFRLEASRRYDNKSVVGGLERMLDQWEGEARLDELPEDLIQFVGARIRDYAHLTEKSRAETLVGIWKRIQRSQSGGQPVEDLGVAPPTTSQPEAASATNPAPARPVEAAAPEPPPAPVEWPRPAAPAPQAAYKPAPRPAEESAPMPAVRLQPRRARGASAGWQTGGEPPALGAPLTVLEGIGPRMAEVLAKLGLHTLRDLLYFFPRRYDDFTRLLPINRLSYGEEVTVIGTIQSIATRPLRGGKLKLVEAVVSDGTGALRVNWFNQVHIARYLHPGMHVSLAGKVQQYLGRPVMENPAYERLDQPSLNTNAIVPVYPTTEGLHQKWLRTIQKKVITSWAVRLPDPLPARLRTAAEVIDLPAALLQIHFPDSWDDLKAAQERLAFDEIFLLQLGVLRQKRAWQSRAGQPLLIDADWLAGQIARLPFPLTGAQQRALADIQSDLQRPQPMNRLVQGDVGSGKTVVAALAAGLTAHQGGQAALMAPTSILAEQHYKNLLRLLAGAALEAPVHLGPPWGAQMVMPLAEAEGGETGLDEPTETAAGPGEVFPQPEMPLVEDRITVEDPHSEETTPAEPEPLVELAPPALQPSEIRLLVGATPEAEKEQIRAGLADGTIKLVIGTHALIEDPVVFQNLQLVIVDEQHRFGVDQRAALRSKGANPHLLVMTATPIPRSLALTVYGDLDLSVIDELPPGRQPVGTYVLMPRERERAYSLIRSQVAEGRQAFIIYPLIEESENSEAKAAVVEQARLQQDIFPKLRVGLLHGRMKPDEKDAVMEDFRLGRYHILVSTTVVEVGVDIPNASVMLIEGANRFGLAQLHQLRGRVGRGAERSFCLLIPDSPEAAENERLQVMAATNDGFVLAERDLEQRGPGQFLGVRQAGYAELQLASLTDVRLIEKARRQAQAIFEQDPDLTFPEHALLASALQQAWGNQADIS